MKNLILKTEEGDLFRFTDSEERTELTIGSRRTADIVVKSQYVEPVQVRLLLKNNIWYAEDMTPENARSVVLLDGRRFKRPMVKFDGVLSIRRAEVRRRTLHPPRGEEGEGGHCARFRGEAVQPQKAEKQLRPDRQNGDDGGQRRGVRHPRG